MQLSVIIVNYNVKYFLEQCLASLRVALQGLAAEVVVVDNHSTDGSVDYLQPLFPELRFLALDHNPGFARGNNLALPHCSGRYVLFLNPDTMVAEDTLTKALAFMEAHPDAGALGIRMIDGSGHFLPESKRGFPDPLTSLYKQLGLHRFFPHSRRFARYYLGHLPECQSHAVDVLAGAFMLLRREVLDTVGSFDERFFMYGEDIDLSYRITQAGWKNYYFAGSTILHFKGESTARASLQYVKHFYQAMGLFVDKHFRGRGARAYRLLLQGAILFRGMLSALPRAFKKSRQNEPAPLPEMLQLEQQGWPEDIDLPGAVCIREQKISLAFSPSATGPLLLVPGYTLSMSAAIRKMEQFAGKRSCWLHHIKTNSLVGSPQKEEAGLSGAFCHPEQAQ